MAGERKAAIIARHGRSHGADAQHVKERYAAASGGGPDSFIGGDAVSTLYQFLNQPEKFLQVVTNGLRMELGIMLIFGL